MHIIAGTNTKQDTRDNKFQLETQTLHTSKFKLALSLVAKLQAATIDQHAVLTQGPHSTNQET
jgi:hypothetical protein